MKEAMHFILGGTKQPWGLPPTFLGNKIKNDFWVQGTFKVLESGHHSNTLKKPFNSITSGKHIAPNKATIFKCSFVGLTDVMQQALLNGFYHLWHYFIGQ